MNRIFLMFATFRRCLSFTMTRTPSSSVIRLTSPTPYNDKAPQVSPNRASPGGMPILGSSGTVTWFRSCWTQSVMRRYVCHLCHLWMPILGSSGTVTWFRSYWTQIVTKRFAYSSIYLKTEYSEGLSIKIITFLTWCGLPSRRCWLLLGTWSHLWFQGVLECPPSYVIVCAKLMMHQFFCILPVRGSSQKIVYIACNWKSNVRIELVFSPIKDGLSMHIIVKYHTCMPISNENIASYIILGFTVRRTSTSSSTSRQVSFTRLNFIATYLE